MKKILITVLTLTTTILISQDTMTYEQKISYMLGYNLGNNVKKAPFTFDADFMTKGMKTALEGSQIEFTEQEMMQALQEWDRNMQAEDQKRATAGVGKNKADGQAFLEKNKLDKDVKVTASGLQYKVIKMGEGPKPASANAKVTVHYEGTLINGTVFDSSYKRGETTSFALNQVISGWTEGLQLMPVGSKFIFYIPSELAYGDSAMSTIPGGSTLIFTIELFSIN